MNSYQIWLLVILYVLLHIAAIVTLTSRHVSGLALLVIAGSVDVSIVITGFFRLFTWLGTL